MKIERKTSYQRRYAGHFTEYRVEAEPIYDIDQVRQMVAAELKIQPDRWVAAWHETRIEQITQNPDNSYAVLVKQPNTD